MNFCESAKAWLDLDENNVVALHCKAGKGRAGIMAACLLVRLGNTAREAVSKYDEVRPSGYTYRALCLPLHPLLRLSSACFNNYCGPSASTSVD